MDDVLKIRDVGSVTGCMGRHVEIPWYLSKRTIVKHCVQIVMLFGIFYLINREDRLKSAAIAHRNLVRFAAVAHFMSSQIVL